MERHLTLIVPGLSGPPPSPGQAPAPRAPALHRLLARADRAAGDRPLSDGAVRWYLESRLCALFGVPPAAGGDLPVAATTRLGDGGASDDGWWIRADPVYLHPQGTRLVLAGSEFLRLTLEEAQGLVTELAAVIAVDGWRLEALHPHRWYLRPPAPPRLHTCSIAEVRGRDIGEFLPLGEDAGHWRRLLTEIQLLLHASPVNAGREQRGHPPVNSLWFWGGGPLPRSAASVWSGVWSGEPLALGLARLARADARILPGTADQWLGEATAAGAHLLVFEPDPAVAGYDDVSAWQRSVEFFEEQWLSPLVAALRVGGITSITLFPGSGTGRHLTRAHMRRWWRRQRPLNFYSTD